jgi:hypothetical protein
MKLRPVSFYLDGAHGDVSKLYYGFTAEEMEPVLPHLVGLDTEGKPNTADYLGLVPVMVKAMQELNAKVKRQQLEIYALAVLLLGSFGFTAYRTRRLR